MITRDIISEIADVARDIKIAVSSNTPYFGTMQPYIDDDDVPALNVSDNAILFAAAVIVGSDNIANALKKLDDRF